MTQFERFQEAIVAGNTTVVEELLSQHKRYATLSDFNGWMPLHYATEMANVELVKLLLPYYDKDSINACTYSHYTPFHTMIVAGSYNIEIATLLIAKGALMETELEKAIYLQDITGVNEYLQEPELVNKADRYGNTPLHNAIAIDAEEVYYLLVNAGADIERVDLYKTTPLHTASADGREWALSDLLNRGAALEKRDYNKRTAMHFAAGNAFLFGVEQLLKSGAEINAQDTFGNTPLHYAYENSEMGIVELLLAHGADSYLRNDDGMSAKELYPEGE